MRNPTGTVQGKLQLTNGYHLHFDQMTRLLNYVRRSPDKARFAQSELAEGTGLTGRKVESLGSIMTRMGLLRPRTYRLAPLGELVLQYDPFFDDIGTLWLGHYYLAADPRIIVWSHMTNSVLQVGQPLTPPEARVQFLPLLVGITARSAHEKLLQEIRSFFNAYTVRSFRHLDYLRALEGGAYVLTDSPAMVPPATLLTILLLYRDRFQPGASGLEVSTICTADYSPGRLLHLSVAQVRRLLNELHESGRLTIEAKANLDQVRFKVGQTWPETLRLYYEER